MRYVHGMRKGTSYRHLICRRFDGYLVPRLSPVTVLPTKRPGIRNAAELEPRASLANSPLDRTEPRSANAISTLISRRTSRYPDCLVHTPRKRRYTMCRNVSSANLGPPAGQTGGVRRQIQERQDSRPRRVSKATYSAKVHLAGVRYGRRRAGQIAEMGEVVIQPV